MLHIYLQFQLPCQKLILKTNFEVERNDLPKRKFIKYKSQILYFEFSLNSINIEITFELL